MNPMSSFFQDGIITNIHALHDLHGPQDYLNLMESKLREYAQSCGISLILPCLFAEIKKDEALDRIVAEIQKVNYLNKVVVALGDVAGEKQFMEAREFFARFHSRNREVKVVWVDGPRIQNIFSQIQSRGLYPGLRGKGQSVWIALGYLLGGKESDVIVLHDSDILTYDRILIARLIEPVANPDKGFEFCKGYYARVSPTDRAMKGRVTRLFVLPFVDTMKDIMYSNGNKELGRFFSFHRSFYYPLAGEFSISSKLGSTLNIAYDWGLEVSMLSEVYNRAIPRKIAQVELLTNYEHKHQDLSPEDKGKGLHRMVVDIAKFYLFYLRSHGLALDDTYVDMIRHTYYQNSLRFIKWYSDDSESNGLVYDRYQEELTARCFRDFLLEAWEEGKKQNDSPLIPSWNRVHFSVPGIYENLVKAVEDDNS